MEFNKEWEFQCAQFIDFNEIDKSDAELEAYFDKKNNTHNLVGRSKSTACAVSSNVDSTSGTKARRLSLTRPIYKFATTPCESKPQPDVNDKKDNDNPFAVKVKTNKTALRQSVAAKVNKYNALRRTSTRIAKKSLYKPAIKVCIPSIKRSPKATLTDQAAPHGYHPAASTVASTGPSTHRPLLSAATTGPSTYRPLLSAATAGPSTYRPPLPYVTVAGPSTHATRPRLTHPTTPQCLKRSLNRTKNVKSSEELELEKIAEMRRKMKTNLDLNKATMKKVRAPALRPIPERPRPPMAAPTIAQPKKGDVNTQKKNETVFKKPTMAFKAKTAIGFEISQHLIAPKTGPQMSSTPYNLRLDRRLSRSESSLPSTSRFNSSSNPMHFNSLNACHTGVKFIPKQDRKLCNFVSSTSKSNNENKDSAFSWKTPTNSKAKTNIARRALLNKTNDASKTNKPFQDRTNVGLFKPATVGNKGKKRSSCASLTAQNDGKRRRI